MAVANRPISTVLNDIVGNVQEIVRSEVRLARIEFSEELGKARFAAMVFGAGVLMLIFSALFLLLAILLALSTMMPAWAAALTVAGGAGAIAALNIKVGIKRFKAIRAVPRTAESLKENVEWARQLTR